MEDTPAGSELSARARRWAGTMRGHSAAAGGAGDDAIVLARPSDVAGIDAGVWEAREEREAREDAWLARGATRAHEGGDRLRPELPDPQRTCFQRDRDRILHDRAFRRLAGKTQVFVFPDDHQRTRLTHALEVAQVATAVARATRLNVALTEAIALAHDCGHGPGGHASEDAFAPYVAGGYDHAVWGADVVLADLNLCRETLDGIRNHSWSRPSPSTPEGLVVSWADRVAYSCHDLEDAILAGIVSAEGLPPGVATVCGTTRSAQLGFFIAALIETIATSGRVGMRADAAESLAELRAFNYREIYLRPASRAQSESVVSVLRALVDYFGDRPNLLDGRRGFGAGSSEAVHAAVTYVGGMTDRFAFATALARLGWDPAKLPAGVDSPAGRLA